MCKLGDKDYWQVGDEVYSIDMKEKGMVTEVKPKTVLVKYRDLGYSSIYFSDGKDHRDDKIPSIFHLGAITFDEQDRPIAINYDYVPDRTPKVMITKLPHEFEQDEPVLVKSSKSHPWRIETLCINNTEPFYYRVSNGVYWTFCVPYKGNEHCLRKNTNCESGKVPDGYVFPKKELFSDVKVDDILYRLDGGKYIRGRVSTVSNDSFYFRTETEVSFKDTLNCIWEYTYKGELQGEEHLGQVLFFEKPEHVFKPFDKVLVRDCSCFVWNIDIYSFQNSSKEFVCIGGNWVQCIPYEGNKHLLGTTNSPEE